MNKEAVKQILVEFQEAKLPEVVSRDISVPLHSGKIITITGVRRSGKTSLIFSLIQALINSGIPKNRISYINFDDPRLLPANSKDLENIIEVYWEFYPENQNKVSYLFLDEIQHIKNWELGVRRLYDTRKFHIFLTGSSSKVLNKDIATNLRGRCVNFEILPFSLKEFLRAKHVEVNKFTPYSQTRFQAKKYLEEYFTSGGFPEAVLQVDCNLKLRILKDYVETMFLKDLIDYYNVKNQVVMRELIKFLVSNTTKPFSLNAFWNWIKTSYPITKRTLIYYLSYLEDAGLVFLTKKFSYSTKEQNLRPRKSYIVDNGLRLVYGFEAGEDKSKVLENSTYLMLRHMQAESPLMEISYWRNGKGSEVDFVVQEGRKVKNLIQVCSDPKAFRVREREILPLVEAMDEFGIKESLVITENYEDSEKINNKKISYLPLWKWILGQN